MKYVARGAWVVVTVTLAVALKLLGSRRVGRPTQAEVDLGTGLLILALTVLLPLAALLSVVAKRRRIAERLGILPPGAGLTDDDEDDW